MEFAWLCNLTLITDERHKYLMLSYYSLFFFSLLRIDLPLRHRLIRKYETKAYNKVELHCFLFKRDLPTGACYHYLHSFINVCVRYHTCITIHVFKSKGIDLESSVFQTSPHTTPIYLFHAKYFAEIYYQNMKKKKKTNYLNRKCRNIRIDIIFLSR